VSQEEGTSEGTSARSEKRLSGTSKAVNSPLLFTSLDTAWQSLLHCSGIIALEDIQDGKFDRRAADRVLVY
jgi:hypothetical protein